MDNAAQLIARKFLNRTNRHIFLTGRAGTGKTTFLKGIVTETHKKTVIAAPTGVAAINAGGVTLHSLFQLPFGTFIPSDTLPYSASYSFEINTPKSLKRHMHMQGNKRRMIREMELLIIDEVSMLRADILDAIDLTLRTVRRQRQLPFGGVQVLFIGDLLQLPPVRKDDEWALLSSFYKSIHFFDALALQGNPPLYIELEKIYRQSDPEFISLLNNLRDNRATEKDVQILNEHFQPGFSQEENEGYIYLTTHNWKADRVNKEELNKLQGKLFSYEGEVHKDFNEHQFPVDPVLELKVGAQVMFIKNDPSGYRRYFNGKIGVVTTLGDDEIEVSFNDGSDPVEVEKYEWLNKKYRLSDTDNEIKEEIVGSFTHFPLKLAWAVTIHKSQGLTFEKAIIDVEQAFAPGQIYVALSRLVSLEGLVLSSRIPVNSFVTDRDIAEFSKKKTPEELWENILEAETHRYVREKLLHHFNFWDLDEVFSQHIRSYTKDEKRSAKQRYLNRVINIQKKMMEERDTAAKFMVQIRQLTDNPEIAYLENLQDRVNSALNYFEPRLRALSRKLLDLIDELKEEVGVKAYIKELKELESYIYAKLQSLKKCSALITSTLNNEDLSSDDFIDHLETEEREKESASIEKKRKRGKNGKEGKSGKGKPKKGDSQKLSYEMFRKGMSLEEISKERGVTTGTIEGHLTHFIREGDLDILEVLDEEKVGKIQKAIDHLYTDSIIPVKKALGDDCSFGEIRMVMAAPNKR